MKKTEAQKWIEVNKAKGPRRFIGESSGKTSVKTLNQVEDIKDYSMKSTVLE